MRGGVGNIEDHTNHPTNRAHITNERARISEDSRDVCNASAPGFIPLHKIIIIIIAAKAYYVIYSYLLYICSLCGSDEWEKTQMGKGGR